MKILPPLIGRALVAITLIAVGIAFIFFGYAIARGGAPYGVGLIVVGALPLIFGPIYFWRGGHLGVEIQEDTLIVRSYFQRQDTVIPLGELLWVHRGASDDATMLEFPDRQFILVIAIFPILRRVMRWYVLSGLMLKEMMLPNHSIQRMRASRSGQSQSSHQRRLALTADAGRSAELP